MFILSDERDGDPVTAFNRYTRYLETVVDRFPPQALALANSEWWFDFSDHRCPHDSWLERLEIVEPSEGARHEIRTTEIRVVLLGAYHDLRIHLKYVGVIGLEITGHGLSSGHGDWRYDEFRLSEKGQLLHEIEWCGFSNDSRWLITAKDLEFQFEPIADAA